MPDLSKLVKVCEVRGEVPDEFNENVARDIGAAFARLIDAPAVIIVRDMRPSAALLSQAFAQGVTSQGLDVIDAGLGSTDLLYFAAGSLNLPGAVFTAGHNPAQYNGITMCLASGAPVGQDTGLGDIRRMLEEGIPASTATPGTITAMIYSPTMPLTFGPWSAYPASAH